MGVSGPNAKVQDKNRNEVTFNTEAELKAYLGDGKFYQPNTMQRTLNIPCVPLNGDSAAVFNGKVADFKNKIKAALAASLDAMIAQKIDVAVVTKLSAGIDAPERFRKHLQDHQFKYM